MAHANRNTNTAKVAPARRESEKTVGIVRTNGMGARSFSAIPAYKLDAMSRVQTACYGD